MRIQDMVLCNLVLDPVEAHVKSFGLVLADKAVGEAAGDAVVGLDGLGQLGGRQGL